MGIRAHVIYTAWQTKTIEEVHGQGSSNREHEALRITSAQVRNEEYLAGLRSSVFYYRLSSITDIVGCVATFLDKRV